MKNRVRQTAIFHDYYSRLKEIAMSVFEWENLPETCSARFLEDTLFHYGQAVFVEDPNMSFLNLKVSPFGDLNVYNEPVAYTAFSTGYNQVYGADDCVIIRNNWLEKSTDSTILLYAERLTELDLAIRVNINAQKTPVLVRCDEKVRQSLKVVYDKYEGNEPVIFGSKSLTEKPIEVLKTDAPFVADKLRDEKRALWNECLEFLGIATNPSDKKKERLIVNEVDSNNEQTQIQAEAMLLARMEACKLINEKYGLNINVKKRTNQPAEGVEDQWHNTQSNLEM